MTECSYFHSVTSQTRQQVFYLLDSPREIFLFYENSPSPQQPPAGGPGLPSLRKAALFLLKVALLQFHDPGRAPYQKLPIRPVRPTTNEGSVTTPYYGTVSTNSPHHMLITTIILKHSMCVNCNQYNLDHCTLSMPTIQTFTAHFIVSY